MTLGFGLALALAIVVGGGLAIWVASRRAPPPGGAPPAPGVAAMGYGPQRWERQRDLWRGTLRRLEIQARHQSPVPDSLQRQLAEARAKIAEAESHLQG